MIREVKIGQRRIRYTLLSGRNRTHVRLKLLPGGEIQLGVPQGFPLRQADDVIRQNLAKLDEALSEMNRQRQSADGTVLYEGRRLQLDVIRSGAARVEIGGDRLIVHAPDLAKDALHWQVKRFFVTQALGKLRAQLDKWSPTVPIAYGRVTVREQKSRWGSCSSKHNLNFNWKLIMAPPECLEYVVIHELCHLLYFNHSRQFWAEVEKRMPGYQLWRKWLKQHGSELSLNISEEA